MIETRIELPAPFTEADVRQAICEALPVRAEELCEVRLVRLTLHTEARPHLFYRATVAISLDPMRETGLLKLRRRVVVHERYDLPLPSVTPRVRPVVIGAGPAGLFCALTLARAGAAPLLLERGRPVEERRRAVDAFLRTAHIDTESNVAFGEGGAGTFSDGKLKCGARDPYNTAVKEALVEHGAPADILYKTEAHVGTDKLAPVIGAVRRTVERLGAEVRFGARMRRLLIEEGRMTGVEYEQDGRTVTVATDTVFLATGHSARDVYEHLDSLGIPMHARPFGLGVRIEHPRSYIDRLMYGRVRGDLEAASYHLVSHLPNGRSVYSFCMCPGGVVVPAATEAEGLVTNGMSYHARDGRNSNAALLVSITPDDYWQGSPLDGIRFQRAIEQATFRAGGGTYRAPCVLLGDLLEGRVSTTLGSVTPSYAFGTTFADVTAFLPEFVTKSLQNGLRLMDEWLPGYAFPEAVLTASETRSTSPIRIERDEVSRTVPTVCGLYPCGEGSGYGGGILSSAVDGVRAACAYLGVRPIGR